MFFRFKYFEFSILYVIIKNKSIWIERTLSTYADIYFVMDQQLDSITLKKAPRFFKGVVCPFPLQRNVTHL
ncbi:hypothetical protein BK729_20765 [Bacillus thuringiensis serovar wratislaviensis]|uniref:Uncharacterized protein n=1 Tax=Bacillus wiedmannii TaxID=1890302 RepID=A0AB73SCY7_9BACI|nr:hypothetical protein DN392_10645 [Bacillus sp. BB51/4]KXY01251.1 hypothetical protein AT260_02570 [Bacillus wiedmannii]OTX96172.1 hypothetical protein BK729_20765 [Bacillus thuringiensis serovar wratislaviensis]PEK19734.1 hypothetical protein CN694_25690 [Bacillus wiedmannii]TCD31606.1 hypothetical protein E0D84_17260 [Bacillus wiedmannii]